MSGTAPPVAAQPQPEIHIAEKPQQSPAQPPQEPKPEEKQYDEAVYNKVAFKAALVALGFAENGEIGPWLESHGYPKVYDRTLHDEIYAAAKDYWDQKNKPVEEIVSEFVGEVGDIAPVMEDEDDESSFEFN